MDVRELQAGPVLYGSRVTTANADDADGRSSLRSRCSEVATCAAAGAVMLGVAFRSKSRTGGSDRWSSQGRREHDHRDRPDQLCIIGGGAARSLLARYIGPGQRDGPPDGSTGTSARPKRIGAAGATTPARLMVGYRAGSDPKLLGRSTRAGADLGGGWWWCSARRSCLALTREQLLGWARSVLSVPILSHLAHMFR